MALLSYDHIGLIPRVCSTIEHRGDCDTSVNILGIKLDVPMISSPMECVTNGEMAHRLAQLGALGIIHRFQHIDEQNSQFYASTQNNKNVGCAIGVIGDYQERFQKLYNTGCRIFCFDTANGFNSQVEKAIQWISQFEGIKLIVGNVASGDGYIWLSERLIYNKIYDSAIRVGIAGGSACTTRTETGVYMPMISSIAECYHAKHTTNLHPDHFPKIIADGGISKPADLCKALAVGADAIMCGSLFAGTKESPGSIAMDKGIKYKIYRGAASFGTQKEYSGKEPNYVEGTEMLIPYKGRVENVINRFKNGLQSSMSYFNSKTLEEYKNSVSWEEIRI